MTGTIHRTTTAGDVIMPDSKNDPMIHFLWRDCEKCITPSTAGHDVRVRYYNQVRGDGKEHAISVTRIVVGVSE